MKVWQLKVELESLHKFEFYLSVLLLMIKMSQSECKKLDSYCKEVNGFTLTNLHHFFIQSTVKPNQLWLVRTRFLALCVSYIIHVMTSSFDCSTGLSVSFWLARVITLVLISWHLVENRYSKQVNHNRGKFEPVIMSLFNY